MVEELNFEKNELKACVENMKRNIEPMLEYYKIQAKFHKAKYDELIKQGFTEQQALELCKNVN